MRTILGSALLVLGLVGLYGIKVFGGWKAVLWLGIPMAIIGWIIGGLALNHMQ